MKSFILFIYYLLKCCHFIRRYTYRCARKGDWGDRLPVSIEGGEINEEILSDEDTEDTEDEKK